MIRLIFIVLIGLSLSQKNILAVEQRAHVHGLASITVVIENNLLEIEVESPADSLLGFEHQVRTEEDKSKLNQTELLLNKPDQLFTFQNEACALKTARVNLSSFVINHNPKNTDHHSHEKHYSHEKNNTHTHDARGHKHKHKDIVVGYLYDCQSTQRLESISINLFTYFPRIEEINVMWINNDTQGAKLITAKDNVISLN